MSTQLERIRAEIRTEYLETGVVNAAAWVAAYPEHRSEIEQFIRSLAETESPAATRPADEAVGPVVRNLISRQMARLRAEIADQLGSERETANFSHPQPVPRGKKTERRAQVYAWATDVLYRVRSDATKRSMQKVLYLLDFALPQGLGLDLSYSPRVNGPYSREVKQAGLRAAQDGLITIKERYHVLRGAAGKEALQDVREHLRDPQIAEHFVEFFGALSDKELERWASIHWAAMEIIEAGAVPDAQGVQQWLQDSGIWSRDVGEKHYSTEQIAEALEYLIRLRLLPPDRVKIA